MDRAKHGDFAALEKDIWARPDVVQGYAREFTLAALQSVPTLVALLAVGSVLALPVQNGISRTIELRADVEALRVTEDPEAFVDLQRRLALRSLADPTPPAWSHWWFGSHPTLLVRVALARS